MQKCSFIVNDINIRKNQLKIDAALVYPSELSVPKIKIIFERNDDIRRLPLVMKGSFNRSRTADKVAIFSYSYLLDYIFTDNSSDDEISVRFEIEYGDEISEKLDFSVSEGIAAKNSEIKIPKEYIGGKIFDGATVYSNASSIEDTEELPIKSYIYSPCPETGKIKINVKENFLKKESSAFRFFSKLSNGLLHFINIINCILLIPYFCIDGFLAGLNLTDRHKAPEVDGLINQIIGQIKANIASYLRFAFKGSQTAERLIRIEERHYRRYYNKLCKKPVVENRISFISGRRNELGGNEQYVYELIKDRKDIDFQFLMNSDLDIGQKNKAKRKFYELYATSKIVIVDDYYSLLNSVDKRKEVTLFQLWHACGAFKTFGFSRLGKTGSPKQTSPSHRMYDYTTVSSEEIRKYYAEGFGINDSAVLATGIPRTDIFSDKEYKEKAVTKFYDKYPKLKNKKIILFAPTFRGMGQKSAYYPTNVFNPEKLIEEVGNNYALLIKLHPFCSEKFKIQNGYQDQIVDMSEDDELNDLLFVTDILITDYSSSVFEASLLDIPMLFYPYDLYQYISERDFYCDFESFVPGKIVFTQDELCTAIKNNDFESYKIEPFRNKFFSDLDGKSSERVAQKIIEVLEGNKK